MATGETGRYEKGLFEIAAGVHAYLQPDGSWGYSNAGLVEGDGASLLVDTLFDLQLTREMLDAMRARTDRAPIEAVVNTHANGDHCYGNQLVAGEGVEIVASTAAAREIDEVPPSAMLALTRADLPPPVRRFVDAAFGPFDFEGIDVAGPTRTFEGELSLDVGGRAVELLEVGPAHTRGDVIAHLPGAGVVFTGDILFHGSTPIMWAGPISNWIAACDRIEALHPSVVVPGHGPLTDVNGLRDGAEYLRYVERGVTERHAAGMDADQAWRDLDVELNGTRFGAWGERERLAVTVHHVWEELDPAYVVPDISQLFARMAESFSG